MEKNLYKTGLLIAFLFVRTNSFAVANIYNWIGTTTGGATAEANWTNYKNWTISTNGGTTFVAAATGQFPGAAATDIAQIGIASITGAYYPTLSTSVTIASLIFGTFTTAFYGVDLTVTGVTLTVTGNIQQNFSATCSKSNYEDDQTRLEGTGTIICDGNFILGDGTTPAANYALVYIVGAQITQLTINGNIVLNAYGPSTTGNGQNYPCFSHDSGTLTLLGQIITNTVNVPTSNMYYNNYDGTIPYPGVGEFATNTYYGDTYTTSVNYLTATNGVTTLNLQNKAAVPTPGTNFHIYFDGQNSDGTVVYNDPNNENQTVYTSTDPGIAAYNSGVYCNLTLSGASTKVATGGLMYIGYNSYYGFITSYGNFSTSGGTVNLSANPTILIYDNWTNSTTVNQGSGTITIDNNGHNTNSVTNNSPGIINEGSGKITDNLSLTNSSGATINGNTAAGIMGVTLTLTNAGTITCNDEAMTYTGAATNTGTVTGGAGALTFGSTYTQNATAATTTTGAGTATFTGNYLNTLGGFTAGAGSVIYDGNYTVNGTSCTFTAGAGTVYFSYTGNQALVDKSTTGTLFNNVTFNGTNTNSVATMSSGVGNFGVSATGTLTMTNKAELVAGSTTYGGASYLTLYSGATGSAAVAPITTTNTNYPISGMVKVQRYVSGTRGYRLLSSPVYAGTTVNGTYSINYLTNTTNGLYLTGVTGTAGLFNAYGNPTLYLYDEGFPPLYTTFLNSNFIALNSLSNGGTAAPTYTVQINGGGLSTSTNWTIPAGNGYYCFYRGNLSQGSAALTTPGTLTSELPSTLATTGTLNQSSITFKEWYNSSAYLGASSQFWNLIGNPYASAIDLNTVLAATTTTGLYMTPYNSTTLKGITKFVYELNEATGNYVIYDTNAQMPYIAGSGASRYIASGQGFFVQAAGAGYCQVIFNETGKAGSTNANAPGLMAARLANFTPPVNLKPSLILKMAADSINTDAALITFDPSAKTQYVINEDAPHYEGQGIVHISSNSSDNVKLSINDMPLQANQLIPLNVNASLSGLYTINLTQGNPLPSIYEIWLKDAFKKDSLDIKNNPAYNFDINVSDTTTYGSNRFTLVIRQNPALMVHLLSFNAAKAIAGVNVVWTTGNEQNYTNFSVERSTDGGASFTNLGGFLSSAVGAYTFLDKNPAIGANMYRLQLTDLNGAITYSQVVTIMYNNTSNQIALNGTMTVYPNPTAGMVNLAINQSTAPTVAASAQYKIEIVNNMGTVVRNAVSGTPTWQSDVTALSPGTYFINVVNASNNSIVGKSTFVKL